MKNLILVFTASLLLSFNVFASNVSSISYAGTNITTGAYVTFVASTPINTRNIMLCDTSGVIIKLAIGAAASEVDQFTMPTTACITVNLTTPIPAGTRISLKAISGTASTGFGSVSFLP